MRQQTQPSTAGRSSGQAEKSGTTKKQPPPGKGKESVLEDKEDSDLDEEEDEQSEE
jgi:hypothetical protein